jgi:hypothetical protein
MEAALPFDSNGTFNRVIPGGWKADAAANIKIRADRHDDEDDGFATGLSTCITKDGRTQPTANIPLNNKKLVAVGEPTNPSDAATKNYVDNFKSFTTGANISGAGPINGFINFTSPTGINGIGWTTADMSWIGKLEEANKTSKRLTVNDAKDGTGTDVAIVDETGRINNTGWLTSNLSYENGNWRTIGLGIGTSLSYAGGSFGVSSNDVATTVDYQTATLRNFFTTRNSNGSASVELSKTSTTEPAQDLLLDGNGQLMVCQGTNGACTGGIRAGAGIMGKAGGYQGNYDNVWHNLYYSGGFEYVYVNATLMGAITWQSDYRIKRNIQPLGSMWDRIKALKPVRYQHRQYREFVKDEPDERWGLLAHEVQEALLPTAAIGNKDEENVIQSINPLVMIAVLTKALQEAMTRIEALEARA